ncbi:L,D-transpeptidase [Williamsia sp. CHRR-6]|uniref:L,D-transpeptidase n=1 Tax=Williamsia sp. CHRR-6 TaxID=2835871 RepID=UPI001BD99127|nr:L,D-transpeptidase [Williamsia sp. CHRR-6]MBT0565465.1 L,D-transpeptidase [Williamsia sp. CHRR-6]
MPGFIRDYWWAALVVPLATAVTAVLVVGLVFSDQGTGSSRRTQAAVPAAVTSGVAGTPKAPVAAPGLPPSARAMCASNREPRAVVVSISQQTMWMCQGPELFGDSPVTTGIDTPKNRTPTGSWRIVARETDRFLTGPDYRVFVHFWMPFFGDFGFHDSPWQRFAYGTAMYKTAGSRGCVHVPAQAMGVLYRWATVGTLVTIRS